NEWDPSVEPVPDGETSTTTTTTPPADPPDQPTTVMPTTTGDDNQDSSSNEAEINSAISLMSTKKISSTASSKKMTEHPVVEDKKNKPVEPKVDETRRKHGKQDPVGESKNLATRESSSSARKGSSTNPSKETEEASSEKSASAATRDEAAADPSPKDAKKLQAVSQLQVAAHSGVLSGEASSALPTSQGTAKTAETTTADHTEALSDFALSVPQAGGNPVVFRVTPTSQQTSMSTLEDMQQGTVYNFLQETSSSTNELTQQQPLPPGRASVLPQNMGPYSVVDPAIATTNPDDTPDKIA
ncbi:unnamed protein product, partial [Amoebophrya sp. A25]